MPRRKRLQPGQTYSSGGGGGGGGIDIGGMLTSIFGGLEADPSFVSAEDAASADMLGGEEMVGQKYQTNSPVKAKTIFDRNEARRTNAAYNTQSIEAENEIARALRQEQGLTPIMGERERVVGGAKNANEIALKKALAQLELENRPAVDKMDLDKQRVLEAIRVLGGQKILPTSANEALYDQKATPALLMDIVSGADANTAANQLKEILAGQQKGIASNPIHAEAFAREKLLQQQMAADRAQMQSKALPQTFQAELASALQEPMLREAELRRRSILEAPTNGLFNIANRKFELNPAPTEMEKMQAGASNIPLPSRIPQQPQLNIGDMTADDLIIDPQTKRILGVKPRQ